MASNSVTKESLLDAVSKELGPQALETVQLSEVNRQVPKTAETLPGIPLCITQNSIPQNLQKNTSAIMVGLKSFIPRWQPGSVIKWTAWRQGFESQDDADYAAVQVNIAAEKWNEADVGVTFQYVPLAKDANFAVCHGGPKGTILASAYFPNNDDLNYVFIYSFAFSDDWKASLWKVLTHELGHVLGLRHEFAMDITNPRFEGDAVQVGEMNPYSVMNYRDEPPEIQGSDVTATKDFYGRKAGSFISGTPIVDFTPQ